MRVLFLCTGNSCRSQMAEGWARHFGQGTIEAASAGIEAHGVNPLAVEAMAEVGLDISRQSSKVIDESMISVADLIITVCDHAQEHCPAVPSRVRQLHWSFEDPAKATGTEAHVRMVFRRVRDEICARVKALCEQEHKIGRREPAASG